MVCWIRGPDAREQAGNPVVKGWRRFQANTAAVAGLVFLGLLVVATLLAWVLAPSDPWGIVGQPFVPPTAQFPFGTDTLGRDVFTGVLQGGRVSLSIGVAAAAIATLVGVLIGGAAGYYEGKIDAALMWVTEYFQIIPAFVLAVVVVTIFTPSLVTVMAAIGLVGWPTMARIVRAEVLALKHRDFVLAGRALGAGDATLIFRAILPNAMPTVIVYASLLVASAILFESSLSFLGLSDPNYMSWGYMVGASRSVLRRSWWMPAFPGLAILITVLSINLVGDGLNDALTPKRDSR